MTRGAVTRGAVARSAYATGTLLLLASTPSNVSAQPVRYGVSAGVAVPAADYGDRGIGPVVRATATWGEVPRHVHLRADLEAAQLTSQTGAVRTVSAILNYLVGGKSTRISPYLYVGGGAQFLSVSGESSGSQWTVGVRAGVGIRARMRAREWSAEFARHVALTDYGTGRDFGRASYSPIVIGVTF